MSTLWCTLVRRRCCCHPSRRLYSTSSSSSSSSGSGSTLTAAATAATSSHGIAPCLPLPLGFCGGGAGLSATAGLALFSRMLLLPRHGIRNSNESSAVDTSAGGHDDDDDDDDVAGAGALIFSNTDTTTRDVSTAAASGGGSGSGGGNGNVIPASTGAGGGSVASSSSSSPQQQKQSGVPTVLSSQHDVTTDERLTELVAALEEKRVARQKKLFEDMIVFEGGALADHESLGYYLIMRDFLHFALYHQRWGYYPKLFRKYRQLMTTGYFDPIPYGSLRSQYDYERYVTKIHETTPSFVTPTQLFQPFYGWVMAEYLVTTLRAKFDPREPLIVYDVGAGTGALALSVLDYLAEHFPDVYDRCEYHVVELNPHLIPVLRNKLVHHYHKVRIHNISILNWRTVEKRRCVVIAVELFSGLPHDCILWDNEGACNEHWFGFQALDNLSTAHERYYPLKDPISLRYLRYLNWMQEETFHNLKVLCLTDGRETLDPPRHGGIEAQMDDPMRVIVTKMMWQHSPWRTAWLPTGQMLMLEVLSEYFPRHHLFAADWSSVRQGLPGVNGPVMQVKMRIAKEIYLRKPIDSLQGNAGMMDIAFPTDFDHLSVVYKRVCGPEKEIASMSHPMFWRTFGGDKTALFTTKSGFNPLLEDFAPFHVFATHHPPEM